MRLLPSLLTNLRAVCSTFPDPRKGRGGRHDRRRQHGVIALDLAQQIPSAA